MTPTAIEIEDEARDMETDFQRADINASGSAEWIAYQLTGE